MEPESECILIPTISTPEMLTNKLFLNAEVKPHSSLSIKLTYSKVVMILTCLVIKCCDSASISQVCSHILLSLKQIYPPVHSSLIDMQTCLHTGNFWRNHRTLLLYKFISAIRHCSLSVQYSYLKQFDHMNFEIGYEVQCYGLCP